MIGEEIALLRRVEGEADAMGEPTLAWSSERVAGCLVNPGSASGSEAADSLRPDGAKASVTVALPKSYTAGKPFGYYDGARVSLVSRGMAEDAEGALRVIGLPMRTIPCPTAWDVLLTCRMEEG